MAEMDLECPREDCDGAVDFSEETSESYTNNGLSVWTHVFWAMAGEGCSRGHQFRPSEVERMEREVTDAVQEGLLLP